MHRQTKDVVAAAARQIGVLVYGSRRRWVVFPGATRAVAIVIANVDHGIVRRRSPIRYQGVHPAIRLRFPFCRRCVVPVAHASNHACGSIVPVVELRIPYAQPVGQIIIGHRLANGSYDRLHARMVEVVPAHDIGRFLLPGTSGGAGAAIGPNAAGRQQDRRLRVPIDSYAVRVDIYYRASGSIGGVAIRQRGAVGDIPKVLTGLRIGAGDGKFPMFGHTPVGGRIILGRPGPECVRP